MENENGAGFTRVEFGYKHTGNLRFIGLDLRANPELDANGTIEKLKPMLGSLMSEFAAEEISWYCYLEHHNGGEVNVNETGIGGYFFKAGTPVPEGCIYYDLPTVNIGYGVYCGNDDNFDRYTLTRDQILSDGVVIPYPEAYWTADQFMLGEDRFGYIIGVGDIPATAK